MFFLLFQISFIFYLVPLNTIDDIRLHEGNRQLVGDFNGIDTLLQALAVNFILFSLSCEFLLLSLLHDLRNCSCANLAGCNLPC